MIIYKITKVQIIRIINKVTKNIIKKMKINYCSKNKIKKNKYKKNKIKYRIKIFMKIKSDNNTMKKLLRKIQ